MSTQKNQQQMMAALKRVRNDIASLTDWIEMELGTYDDEVIEQDGHGFNWSDVGSLQKVRHDLIQTLAFLSGNPDGEKEIHRSLDELHL